MPPQKHSAQISGSCPLFIGDSSSAGQSSRQNVIPILNANQQFLSELLCMPGIIGEAVHSIGFVLQPHNIRLSHGTSEDAGPERVRSSVKVTAVH